jgi:hypothetical protein
LKGIKRIRERKLLHEELENRQTVKKAVCLFVALSGCAECTNRYKNNKKCNMFHAKKIKIAEEQKTSIIQYFT